MPTGRWSARGLRKAKEYEPLMRRLAIISELEVWLRGRGYSKADVRDALNKEAEDATSRRD